MLVAEMITDQERLELIELINQFLISKQGQSMQSPTIKDKLGQAQTSKISRLARNYYASDINNSGQVTDDDKVMARRSYLAAKNKT